MFGVALSLSIASLLIGPLVTSWMRGRASALRTLDAAMLGIVLPLLLLRLVPHLVDEIGAVAVAAVALGYALFTAIEARTHGRTLQLGAAILLPTMAVHSFLDGTALAIAFDRGVTTATGWTLGAALVLHRIPEGLVLASALIPILGLRGTMVRISVLAALTLVGALVGRELLVHTPDHALHLVVAIGIGVMLRMALHHHPDPTADRRDWRDGFAFFAATAISIIVPGPWELFRQSQPHELPAVQAIVPLFVDTAPWIFAALALGQLANRVLPAGGAERARPAAWLVVMILATTWLGPLFAGAVLIFGLAIVVGNGAMVAPASWVATLRAIVPRATVVLPSYAAGIAIATTIEAAVPAGTFGHLGLAAVPLAGVASGLLRIGIVGALPIASILVHKGASLGAGLAFVLVEIALRSVPPCSPAWSRLFPQLLGVCGIAIALGPFIGGEPPLHHLAQHVPAWIDEACAVALAAWMAIELARRGPRRFLDAIR